ncbi:MAG: cupin domain-containing protein [Chloroflexota bacterium]
MKPKIVRNSEGTTYETSPIERLTMKLSSADTNNAVDYSEGSIGYLSGPPLHIHHTQDEIFHVLKGELRIQIDKEAFDLGMGDVAFAPRGIPHTFTNLNQEPAHVIGIAIGGGFDHFYAEFVAAVAEKANPEQLAELSERHKIQIVGPPLAAMMQPG